MTTSGYTGSGGAFERTPAGHASFEDIDQAALEAFIERRAPHLLEDLPLEQAAARLGFGGKIGSLLVPTVAGLLLFGNLPQLLHPNWGVVAIRVRGRLLTDPIAARADIEGNISSMLNQASTFVREHTQAITNQVAPEETSREYPEAAVNEAIANALIHRDLRLSARVAVRIFDDRLEVWSPGAPLAKPSMESLTREGGISVPRNMIVASASRVLGMGEQLGRGLATIRRALSDVSVQSLDIRTTQTDVMLVLPSALQTASVGVHLS